MDIMVGLCAGIIMLATVILVGMCAWAKEPNTHIEEENAVPTPAPEQPIMGVEQFVGAAQKVWAAKEVAYVAEQKALCLYDIACAGEHLSALKLAIQSESRWEDALCLLADAERELENGN